MTGGERAVEVVRAELEQAGDQGLGDGRMHEVVQRAMQVDRLLDRQAGVDIARAAGRRVNTRWYSTELGERMLAEQWANDRLATGLSRRETFMLAVAQGRLAKEDVPEVRDAAGWAADCRWLADELLKASR